MTAALLILTTCAVPGIARAAQGDCGQPQTDGTVPNTSDCLIMLRVSVGLGECDPPCICDVNSTATVTTTDALLCLKKAVGHAVELMCPCAPTTTTMGPTSTSTTTTSTTMTTTTTESTTTTTPVSDECPVRVNLLFLSGVRGACATNDDCAVGACDEALGSCIGETELDLGWTGRAHDADVNDSARALVALACDGAAPVCGECAIGGLDPAANSCRCEDNNRSICNEPFVADEDDCAGATCNCYFGPPLPLSAGDSPLCLVNRLVEDVSGTLNPDTGDLTLDLALRSIVFSGERMAPCPACGGRCLAPPDKLDAPCVRSSDCDTESETGTCGRFDEFAGDGVRGGLCVGGPNEGFGCDVDAFNTTFPIPGGSGASLDCFPPAGSNVSGAGLAVRLHQTTFDQTLESGVPCGIPGIAELSCPCGLCGDTPVPCSSDADCEPPATCAAASGDTFPNACDGAEAICTTDDAGEGTCQNGPTDRFCDQIVRENGRGLLGCQTNADCTEDVIGVAAGICSLEEQRECFAAAITAAGRPDPQNPMTAAVSCVAPTSNPGINSAVGLPGPTRLQSELSVATFCDTSLASVYLPGDGCQ